MWTPPLRESFAMPFLMLEILAVTQTFRYKKRAGKSLNDRKFNAIFSSFLFYLLSFLFPSRHASPRWWLEGVAITSTALGFMLPWQVTHLSLVTCCQTPTARGQRDHSFNFIYLLPFPPFFSLPSLSSFSSLSFSLSLFFPSPSSPLRPVCSVHITDTGLFLSLQSI